MSDAYDPTQEFPANPILIGAAILTALAFATVFLIITLSESEQQAGGTPAASAPAAVASEGE